VPSLKSGQQNKANNQEEKQSQRSGRSS